METIVKRIDVIFDQLKICAYGRTLPSGNETGCNPAHFASYVKQFFEEVDKLNKKNPAFWKNQEYIMVYDCERLSRHDLAWASDKACKDSEEIVLKYLDQITEIVEIIHHKAKNN